MTDASDPQQLLDELASAHLDGLTTPDEAARIESDPDMQARVAALARVRAAVARVEPPADDPEREAAIAAALAAFDEAESDHAAAAVTPLAAARARRGLRYAAVAAAVVLAVLAVPLLGRLDSGQDDDETATVEDLAGDASTVDRALESGGADASKGDALTTFSLTDLGDHPDIASLAVAVRERGSPALQETAAPAAGSTAAPTTTAPGCETAALRAADTVVVVTATARVAGRPVSVLVYEDEAGAQQLVVVDQASCAILLSDSL